MITGPGGRVREWTARFCGRDTMERLVDPILSDLRLEYHDARSRHAHWRARWLVLSGYLSLVRALMMNAFTAITIPITRRGLTIASAAIPLAAWIAATTAGDVDFGLLFLLGPAGGLLIAGLLLRKQSMSAHSGFNPDPFRGPGFDTLNFAHVRVAGLGGAGLLVAAFVVALQYPLTTVSIVCGIVGGAVLGVTLIRRRRRA